MVGIHILLQTRLKVCGRQSDTSTIFIGTGMNKGNRIERWRVGMKGEEGGY